MKFSQNVYIGRRGEPTSVTKTCRRCEFGLWEQSLQPQEAMGIWGEAPIYWAIFCNALEKIAVLILMPFGSHFARFCSHLEEPHS